MGDVLAHLTVAVAGWDAQGFARGQMNNPAFFLADSQEFFWVRRQDLITESFEVAVHHRGIDLEPAAHRCALQAHVELSQGIVCCEADLAGVFPHAPKHWRKHLFQITVCGDILDLLGCIAKAAHPILVELGAKLRFGNHVG